MTTEPDMPRDQPEAPAPIPQPGSSFPDLKFRVETVKVMIAVTFEIKDQERADDVKDQIESALADLKVYGNVTVNYERLP